MARKSTLIPLCLCMLPCSILGAHKLAENGFTARAAGTLVHFPNSMSKFGEITKASVRRTPLSWASGATAHQKSSAISNPQQWAATFRFCPTATCGWRRRLASGTKC